MTATNKITLTAFLLIAFSSQVMAQADYCHVLTGWVDRRTGHSTSLFNFGHFCPDITPDNYPVIKTVVHENSGIKVKVGVEYWTRTFEKNRVRIKMAMSLDDNEESDVFFSINSVYAETFRDRHWQLLQVIKRIVKDDKEYEFIFQCFKQTKQSRKFYKCDN